MGGRLIDIGVGLPEQGEGIVGAIERGRQRNRGRQRCWKEGRVHAIPDEGIPDLENDIHGCAGGREKTRRGMVVREGLKTKRKKTRVGAFNVSRPE